MAKIESVLNTINGVPTHVLLVHAVVVLVPLAALLALLSVAWPAARRRLGIVTPLSAFAAVLFIPLATHAGEWLQEHVRNNSLVEHHVAMGDTLLPVAGLLFLVTGVLWLIDHRHGRGLPVPSLATAGWVRPVGGTLVVLFAVLSVVQVYRIGDSGAKAAWHNRVSVAAVSDGG